MPDKRLIWRKRIGSIAALLIGMIVGVLTGGIVVGAFYNVSDNPRLLVAFSAFLATFIASVMAEEQDTRLRNGTFGAIAGTSVGGLAALLIDDKSLLLVGIFGSSCGAILGWLVYLCLSFLAATEIGRRLLEYQFGGLKAVREKLELDDKEKLHQALHVWSQNFSRVVTYEKSCLCTKPSHLENNFWIRLVIKNWLTTITDVLNLVFDGLAKKEKYRSRVSLIIFGQEIKVDANESTQIPVGRHWISYAGKLPAHKNKPFDDQSVAYKVLMERLSSPHLTTIAIANSSPGGQNRRPEDEKDIEKNKAEESYVSFYSFRISDKAILSVDWPGKLEVNDPFIDIFKELFQLDVVPAIDELLKHWHGPIEEEIELIRITTQS